MIAKVVVDIAVSRIDRVFDYLIPEKWCDLVEKGMRVIVPFGARKVQGFVIDIKETSEVSRLKEIDEVLDLSPVLTEELIQLADWLNETLLSFMISTLQAMLPTALKVKVKKHLQLKQRDALPEELTALFTHSDRLDWQHLQGVPRNIMKLIRDQVNAGVIEVVHEVREKGRHKFIKVIEPNVDADELERAIATLHQNATKQKAILTWFKKNRSAIPLQHLLEKVDTSRSAVQALIDKELLTSYDQQLFRNPYDHMDVKSSQPLPLTAKQQKVYETIIAASRSDTHETILLHGVTGSGKTEIYLQSIQHVLQAGKEAIVLVPEISLTPQMVSRFKERFGAEVAVLHSRLSSGEKYDEWRKIQLRQVKVVVGARSAIFAPFTNIGMIIIDEEHETSYKQEDNPRYHAREVAIWRGKYHRCPIILGSATPTLESYARAKKGVYRLSELDERVHSRAMPEITAVDMREEFRNGNRSMFSRVLYEKLKDRLDRNEQTVLFLNRRGFSTFIICRDCGYVAECPHCDISLTFHKSDESLKCHYCGHKEKTPTTCPTCGSDYIRFFGTGTQKVEAELTKLFPEARIIRMDVDTTSRKGAHEKLLNAFSSKQADILLGTQMIAKGLDFPDVTLVGVLAADTMLHLPDFRAAEKTFQLLTQVSGRAGRHELHGEVVIQSYDPDHYSIQYATKHDYKRFYETEMKMRKRYAYPPFYFLSLITISHPEMMNAFTVSDKITSYLERQLSSEAVILGPAASAIPRIKDRYRFQCMIKYKNEPNLLKTLRQILHQYADELGNGQLQIAIDQNPQMVM